VPKLSQSHLAKRHHDTALPVLGQHPPNSQRRAFAHCGIQANAPGRSALGIQPSVIRRSPSIYQRHYKWHIERCYCRLKDFRRVATPYDKLARNFFSGVCLVAAVAYWL
jgi:transposase